eukprot:g47362.t1
MVFFSPFFLAVASASQYTDAALRDQITDLPDVLGQVPFNQFAGYLTINETSGRHMFYWYVESQRNPAKDPVALWTNGGPGCSGLIGFMTENGPFRPLSNGSLQLNPYSWNNNINYLFVEQPIGVGFSYSEAGGDDYNVGDERAAADNYLAIQQFLLRFPEVSTNDFYLTSESYGGHYLPTLAQTIIKAQGSSNSPVNFKGFAVGNPYTDVPDNSRGNSETLWGHQVVPRALWDQYGKSCNGMLPHPAQCQDVMAMMDVAAGQLNRYALEWPLCAADTPTPPGFHGSAEAFYLREYQREQSDAGIRERLARYRTHRDTRRKRVHGLLHKSFDPQTGRAAEPATPQFVNGIYTYDPCTSDYTATYLNRADVQSAIHAKPPPFNKGVWSECADIPYNRKDSYNSMLPIYKTLLGGKGDQRYLVFSGDNDDVCSTMSTQDWIYGLGYSVNTHWKEYVTNAGLPVTQTQVGGFYVEFATPENQPAFSFVTVHGAGHEVPAYKPAVALELLERYISGDWFAGRRHLISRPTHDPDTTPQSS